jgi:hypothetical protein
MYLIKLQADNNNSRPPLLEWHTTDIPEGYAICPNKFYDVFYMTEVASGFVNITVENNIVTSMEVNQEALDAYIASLPEPEEPVAELDMYDELAAAIREGVNEI